MCGSLALFFTNSDKILKPEAAPLLVKTFNKGVYCGCDFLPQMLVDFICPKSDFHFTQVEEDKMD